MKSQNKRHGCVSGWLRALTAPAVILAVVGCGRNDEGPVGKPPVRPVKTFVVGERLPGAQRSFPGQVQASEDVELSFEVAGRIVELPVSKGQEVKKADLIARLDQRDFKNNVAKARARYEEAKVNLERADRLLKSGAIAQAEHDSRKASFDKAEAQLRIAEKALEDSTLKAPFDGRVAHRYAGNLDLIKAQQPIVSLQNTSNIEIRVNIPEDVVARVPKGKWPEARAGFEALPEKTFPVTVVEFGTRANEQSQTFPVTFAMPAPKEANILPGMTSTVTMTLPVAAGAGQDQHAVPVTAVFTVGDKSSSVWKVDPKAMTVHRQKVEVGPVTGSSAIIWNGLKPGDVVVTAGVNQLREGMEVRFLEDKKGVAR